MPQPLSNCAGSLAWAIQCIILFFRLPSIATLAQEAGSVTQKSSSQIERGIASWTDDELTVKLAEFDATIELLVGNGKYPAYRLLWS